jgi:hypothetical protein
MPSADLEQGKDDDSSGSNERHEVHFDPTQDRQRYIAEILHIIRPLCHRITFYIYYFFFNLSK